MLFLLDIGREQILNRDLCKFIIQAMNNFPTSETLQYHGCAALWTAATNEEIKDKIVTQNGINAIMKAMENFPDSDIVQYYGYVGLLKLCSSKQLKCDDMNRLKKLITIAAEKNSVQPLVETLFTVLGSNK
eukprot:TRINITY_DN6012_c0_g2_i2.p1 TRINITY_DN6012_c0_g2~~TRINITY_DN6012_c0_g2_i2.p1  ORF type:complete len:131 (+),score=16.45 TRINITY_DN6012_c0_g2_i2:404-796(+)